jgi:hypothetical protein
MRAREALAVGAASTDTARFLPGQNRLLARLVIGA